MSSATSTSVGIRGMTGQSRSLRPTRCFGDFMPNSTKTPETSASKGAVCDEDREQDQGWRKRPDGVRFQFLSHFSSDGLGIFFRSKVLLLNLRRVICRGITPIVVRCFKGNRRSAAILCPVV